MHMIGDKAVRRKGVSPIGRRIIFPLLPDAILFLHWHVRTRL